MFHLSPIKHKRAAFVTARWWLLNLLLGFFFVDLDYLAALVVPAIGTDSVRQTQGAAIAARDQVARR
jgi:hypothetical protein